MFEQKHRDSFGLKKGVTGGGESLSEAIIALVKGRSVYIRVLMEGSSTLVEILWKRNLMKRAKREDRL